MSHKGIMKEIRRYEKLKRQAQIELRKYEEELEALLAFKNRFYLGEEEFYNNISHRRSRAESVNAMSQHIKSGQAYYKGMFEDLTGEKYQTAMNNINAISESIDRVIKWLEEKIEQLKEKIAEYERIIEALYEELDRDDD